MRPCLTLLDKLGLDKGPYSMFIKVNDEGDASIDTSYAYGKYTNYEIASILSTISFKIKWYLEAYQEQLRAYINRGEYERGRSVGRDIVTLKKWLEDIKNFTK